MSKRQSTLTRWMTPGKKTGKKPAITPEQQARIEANRKAALERLKQRSPKKPANNVQTRPASARGVKRSRSSFVADNDEILPSERPAKRLHRSNTDSEQPVVSSPDKRTRSARAAKKVISYRDEDDSDDGFTVPRKRKRSRQVDDDFEVSESDLATALDDVNEEMKLMAVDSDEENHRPKRRRRMLDGGDSSEDDPIMSKPSSKKRANNSRRTPKKRATEDRMDVDDQESGSGLESMGKFDRGSQAVIDPPSQRIPSHLKSWTDVEGGPPSPQAKLGQSKKDVRGESWYKDPRDLSGRRPGEEGYNPSELRIPESAYKKMSPAHAQYWKIKTTHNDGILFFKVGKFYELFFKDAEIGHEIVGLDWMQDEIPHVGFPETSFDKYAESFVKYGYRVYRIEQMETAEATKRAKKKTVRREICQVLTKGTLADSEIIGDDDANFLLCVVEDEKAPEIGGCAFGVCFVDCGTGQFYVGNFTDDRSRSRFRTLLVQIRPSEIIFRQAELSEGTRNILRTDLRDSIRSPLVNGSQFWGVDKARTHLESGSFWEDGMPPTLQSDDVWANTLTMSAIAGIVGYLNSHVLDELFRNSAWKIYDPVDGGCSDFLVLDGPTLTNLEVLENEDGGVRGTLFEFINKTRTAFGKRLLRQWIRQPLNKIAAIENRLEAVEYLISDECVWNEDIRENLKKLPDLPRLLSRISALGAKNRKMDEAIMFDDMWKSRKIVTFVDALKGLNNVAAILQHIREYGAISSPLIAELTMRGGRIPDFEETLRGFCDAFDMEQAKKTQEILPERGILEEYDKIANDRDELDGSFESELRAAKKKMGTSSIKWHHPAKSKDKYQIEVPITALDRKGMPHDWVEMSKTKKVKRFHTPKIKELLEIQKELNEQEEIIVLDYTRRMFEKFAKHGRTWRAVVEAIAELDCLLSLAITSQYGENMTRPQFIRLEEVPDDKPFLELRGARHPCVAVTGLMSSTTQFIPNDTVLGIEENPANFVVVTGPNMGGKSTLLRQACVNVILAHVGCYVPADLCRLTPVDRIFTRVGANDRILAGQSTFMVELEETSNILRHATRNSLVILDELGRGTSTFDGTSIAFAVAKELVEKTQCRTLFSTHYHSLCDSLKDDVNVGMYHMSFHEQNGEITFLYKFTKGICEDSHGVHCARLAGLPRQILNRATQMGEAFRGMIQCSSSDRMLLNQFELTMGALMEENDERFKKICGKLDGGTGEQKKEIDHSG